MDYISLLPLLLRLALTQFWATEREQQYPTAANGKPKRKVLYVLLSDWLGHRCGC